MQAQFGKEQGPLPAQTSKRDQRRHRSAVAGNIWRAVGTAYPPIVRYGTVLRAILTSDTKSYQSKISFKIFLYLSGTYRMQTPTTEEARNTCGLRLPVWTGNDLAWLVPFHPDDLFFFRPLPSDGGNRKQCVRSLSRTAAPQRPGPALATASSTSGECRCRSDTIR